jgi:hypothetical protein
MYCASNLPRAMAVVRVALGLSRDAVASVQSEVGRARVVPVFS